MEDEVNALASYGTLSPGETNHWVVARIVGDWVAGTTPGYTFEITWGPAEGYPGFLPHRDGTPVDVQVLMSDELTNKWHEIDQFEGPGYERQIITVDLVDGRSIEAQAYITRTDID